MSWIGVESADDERARGRRPPADDKQDWMLKVRLEGRTIEARLLSVTERDAHAYAQRLSAEYTLRPAR